MIGVDTNGWVRLVVGGSGGARAARLFEREPEWALPTILLNELHNVLVGFIWAIACEVEGRPHGTRATA